MNPDAADPATPLSRAPSSRGARSQPDNLMASPSCKSIFGNSDAEAQFEPSGTETMHAANQIVSPTPVDYPVIMVANEQDVSISSLAYFSNSKLTALSRRIGNTQVTDLLAKIEAAVKSTTRSPVGAIPYPNDLEKETRSVSLSQQSRLDYLESYFDQVHPLYPFLDRASFENRARSSRVGDILSTDPAWCALHHAVLALGSLYHECGSFNAFAGTAWDIFRISLALLPRLVFGQRNLLTVQAITAMALFGTTYAALPIEGILITEAARIVSYFQMNKAEACKANSEFQRTVWVIYSLENLEPFVLPWVQYNMPQAALFVLFDFIIEHPCHDETRKDLSYMQIATSYFMRLQYATGNKAFGTIPTQFLQIATSFVEDTYPSSIIQPGASANPQESELWQSRDSGIGTSDIKESLGFQSETLELEPEYLLRSTLGDSEDREAPQLRQEENTAVPDARTYDARTCDNILRLRLM
ncbi:hypothetical protein FocTR4_00014832 [Fusarium oxysporum f. sp. cubense]|uniref:Transcription factor domain-containing protein n=1 Tax=Fusarium oxysporum f. sp. cubense TaxID=61366 RepID=A0A5C6SXF5_FUSOC|nr:hypothetical protein FocTR4_00014832 [Fusarium oxysporum f. sp. cubense]